ncbi:ATP-binding protein [Streptomyces sp. NPDC051742]|uniref:ATP-binding protein n=1 Tax=unclassified Streptomyces TaxID=2593676 RepID=UPI003433BAB3
MYLNASAPLSSSSAVQTRVLRAALLAVPAEAARVSQTRHFTTAVLRTWGLGQEVREAAELVVAELAANAVQYGGGELTLRLSLAKEGGHLFVAVQDSGRRPRRRPARDCDPCERGRGTEIVEYVTEWVHIDQHPGGRRVETCIRVWEPNVYARPDSDGSGGNPERTVVAAA